MSDADCQVKRQQAQTQTQEVSSEHSNECIPMRATELWNSLLPEKVVWRSSSASGPGSGQHYLGSCLNSVLNHMNFRSAFQLLLFYVIL